MSNQDQDKSQNTQQTDEIPVEENTEIESDSTAVESADKEETTADTELEHTEPLIQLDYSPMENVHRKYPTEKDAGGVSHAYNEAISLLKITDSEFQKFDEANPLRGARQGKELAEWLNAISFGRIHNLPNDTFSNSLNRPDSEWRQYVEHQGKELTVGRPRFDENQNGEKLTGAAAIARMQTALGVGSPVRVPLWHTGIWVTISAPTDAALTALTMRISQEKVVLGRLSNGMVFSNTQVYTNTELVDFILDHVTETTVRTTSKEDLKEIILTTDIPTLAWGMITAMYPSGYPYHSPCISDPSQCTYVLDTILNLSRIHWVDNSRITDAQRRHMLSRTRKVTPEEIERYQAEFKFNDHATVEINDRVKLNLKIPTIAEYENIGVDWVEAVIRATEESLGTRASITDERRNEFIMKHATASIGRQYAHWVDSIVYENDSGMNPSVVDDPNDILLSLDVLVGDRKLGELYRDAVTRFIEASTVAVVAIPRYDCPKCGGSPREEALSFHPRLIPIDVTAGFFTINSQRLIKVQM